MSTTPERAPVPVRFASDINPLLAEAFLDEAPVHASRFSAAVSRLTGENPAQDDLVQAQHAAHSLKGSSNITGVVAIADLTHRVEDVLDWLADNAALPPAELRHTLQEAADCVAAMVEALRDGGTAPEHSVSLMASLRDWLAEVESGAQVESVAAAALASGQASEAPGPAASAGGEACAAQAERPASGEEPASELQAAPREDLAAAAQPQSSPASAASPPAPEQASPEVAASAAIEADPAHRAAADDARTSPSPRAASASLRVPVELVDRLLRLAGEFAVCNVQAQGAQQRMTAQANTLREQYHLVQQRLTDLQDLVEVRGIPSGQRAGTHLTGSGTVVDGFDPLELDEYNELHSKTTALAEAMNDFCEVSLSVRPELGKLDDTITDQQRISKELSDFVMSARMVPVGSAEERLHRAVRETCRATGKRAELSVTGGNIPVDGEVLNALIDPLVHLLRNAVDHGIETASDRRSAGKSEVGHVSVDFSREGDNLLARVADDGRGFDVQRIRQVAESRGLLSGDETRTRRELMQLAVDSGFSTREQATQVSGRGIGMDVVNRAALELKGSLDISSEQGVGATISLRVPLTLISMHVLLVRVGSRVFGVPSSSLEQVLFSDAGTLSQESIGTVFTIDEREYRVCHLDALTGRHGGDPQPARVSPMLLMQADSGLTAVVVDAAVDGRYLVVKSLGEFVPRPAGVIGASILGDGSVAPVLDLRELLRHRSLERLHADAVQTGADEPEEAPAREVLVVDDSLTARRMLSITLDDAGYRVRTAIDGLDAVEAVEECMPDLIVTDLEMPRMNGLELAAHLRGADGSVPILMVTSRSTDKHRGQAEVAGINAFITKPYSNDELLDQVKLLLEPVAA